LRWLGSALVVGVVSTVVVLVLCGLLIAAMTAGSGYGGLAGKVVAGSLAQLPAALVYLAVLALVFAVAPRATVGAGWGMLAAGTFLSVFGQLVGVPNWLRDLSPSSHTPALPLQDVHWSGAVWMVGISVVLVVVSARVLHRRDLAAG
jgi:ABC-2 type transport system permease protein